jgi:hypothetical protein
MRLVRRAPASRAILPSLFRLRQDARLAWVCLPPFASANGGRHLWFAVDAGLASGGDGCVLLSVREPSGLTGGVRMWLSLLGVEESKGIWWMPWRQEAMKDVARCDKPWGAASRL